MGKKHKKHKSEKHMYEEYGERPLKLVLKVAGNEVTTGSSSREHIYDEKPDYDKHKDKKKKKKKREDKDRSGPVSPVDEKKKKKMTKKRKGETAEADWDDRDQSRTPILPDLPPSMARIDDKEQTPLQEALSQLIRQLQRKDPSAFFSFPVTDLIAPGYSTIIKRPMDFGAMKEKVKKEYYQSLEELKVDFRIMCENAMIYNKPETIYHKAARKLLHSGMKILSSERLDSLKQSIEFMADLENPANKPGKTEEEGGSAMDQSKEGPIPTDVSETSQSPSTPRQDKDSKEEVSKVISQAEKELEEIRKIIEDSGGKLSSRGLQSQLDFERRKSDGSTTLAILNPVNLAAGDVGYCPVKLGMMSNRLQSGINTLQGFKEDKRNRVTPVAYMNYGPFTSYAPAYDSSFANISKDDSDLIYSFYGEESSLQGSESLSEFVAKSEEHIYKLADNVLDALTNGEHSETLRAMEASPQTGQQPSEAPRAGDDIKAVEPEGSIGSRLASLDSVIGLGLDPQTPENLTEEAQHFQQKLDETTKLLHELQEAQRERLSAKQPPNIICLLAPTTKELQLAEKVTGNLAQLTSQVAPGDVSNVYGIRKAMGISLPQDPEEPLIDLTTVEEMPEPMDILSGGQEAIPVIVV